MPFLFTGSVLIPLKAIALNALTFGLSKISFILFFGIGCGFAIIVDARMVPGVLVPAVMRLVGERIW
jgi:putative drug exporter of the RND superfamily